MKKSTIVELGPLENAVMRVIWDRGDSTAEDVRKNLEEQSDLKESTIRTVLSRLERKGLLGHRTEQRTYVYFHKVEQADLAVRAVKGIVDRFCEGSVSDLLLGMANDSMISVNQLEELAERIKKAREQQQ